jgi:MFS family permease
MLTYHFQVILRYSPLQAGLAFLPLTAAVSISAYALASRLIPHVAPRMLIVPGLVVAAMGLLWLSMLHPGSSYAGTILPAQLLLGLGMGCVFTPAITVATTGVEPREAGIASAVANTAMQVGGSVGTAVLNTVAITATGTYVASHVHTGAIAVRALVHGYATATMWSAGVLAAVAFIAALLINSPTPRPYETSRS